MTDSRETLIGRTLDGRYRIESLVARGGMATVYVANDLRLRRNVAVKVMHTSLAEDPEFVHRFEREAHAAAQLTNPHVVAVHDQGRDAHTGVVYLVMEYVSGRTVRDIMAARGALTETQALAILDPVLQALAAAHDAGFVHRDVKPENVLISDDGRIKVTDFGLARAIVASPMSAATQGVLIGTVAYLSPEQVDRGYADARSDVYGAGVLLYELLTGNVPHTGETPLAVAYQHVHNDVPAPSVSTPGLSATIDTLVEKATRRDPAQRFQNAREFLAAVRTARAAVDQHYTPVPMPAQHTVIIDDEPSPAQRTVTLARDEQPRRRRRKLPLAAGLVALTLAAGWYFTVGTHSAVPDVVGLQQSTATDLITGASLAVAVDAQWSKTVPEGAVISTDPEAGTNLPHGELVNVLVSKGPERYAVPNLVGNSLADAKSALAEVKLDVGRAVYVYDNAVPSGRIISSRPASGTIMQPKQSVDVTISKGPAPVPIPNVSGKALADAASTLTAAGFTTSSATEFNDTVKSGLVISTDPRAGVAVQRGSSVKILVSKGPAPVKVPDVFKLSRSRAESVLKAAGLKVTVKTSGKRLINIVQDQSPKAGTVVPRGTTVTITIV
jgi:beta-lactam-binding protein with PASTA domain